MYKKLTIWSVFLLLFAAGTAAAELKIAVLDTQRALVESEEAQALLAQAQQELQAEQECNNLLPWEKVTRKGS